MSGIGRLDVYSLEQKKDGIPKALIQMFRYLIGKVLIFELTVAIVSSTKRTKSPLGC